MRDKRIKLIFFSLRGSEVKDFDLGWKKIVIFASMLTIILIILVGAVVGLFTNFYKTSKMTSLQKTNQMLKTELGEIRRTINDVTTQMEKLEADDDEQRLIAGLDTIDKDMRNAGQGGPHSALNYAFSSLPRDTREEVTDLSALIDQLEKRIQLAMESKNEVTHVLELQEDRYSHLPSIRPVEGGGRITSKFGPRLDPFTERMKTHSGIDIAAPLRTPVYAAAQGVVTKVNQQYSPNREYGKYIVIDHGFGKETLYGHLLRIDVRVGQQVKRWEQIGAVGQTGRATGPHLHYEVRENGVHVNPVTYFFE
jgi:murein DD-endopeptidase MepM/ murein hydrolase activator NlpD